MTNTTLTSLALLKLNIDQGSDYLNYLRPFVIQVLMEEKPEKVTDSAVTEHIRNKFDLVIPNRTVQVVLQRLAKQRYIEKKNQVYSVVSELPESNFVEQRQDAERHINSIVKDFIEFSKTTHAKISQLDEESAITSICAFLSQFDIVFLRAYLRGTVIPDLGPGHEVEVVLVSKFLIYLQQEQPERFESFLRVVQGHMLANALLCPDLDHAKSTYNDVAFYFDTPLLIRALDLEGSAKKNATNEIIRLLRTLGGKVAAFSHSREELETVVKVAATKIESRDGRGAIITEARRRNTTKSDLILLALKIDEKLKQLDVDVYRTPPYTEKYQIDEKAFGQTLDDEVSYSNERARECDINSVRSIYELRKGKVSVSVEKSKAMLVTSNTGLARAAWQYGQENESSRDISSTITDFSLANIAWLKAPMGAPQLPKVEVLAYSYAALQPSNGLLNKLLVEIDKLEQSGKISPRDHQLLRSDVRASDELMNLTMGDETALTEETISATLERVSAEIKKEEASITEMEKAAHDRTKKERDQAYNKHYTMIKEIYWRCDRRAKAVTNIIQAMIFLFLFSGMIAGSGISTSVPILGLLLITGSLILALLTMTNLMFGSTVSTIIDKLRQIFLRWCLKREARILKFDINDALNFSDIPTGRDLN